MIFACVGLLLSGCASAQSEAQTPRISDAPAGFEEYYGQQPQWESCGDKFQCATMTAPMDWSDPDSPEISLAVRRTTPHGNPVGSLFFNPGGPGGSGVWAMEHYVDSISPRVLDQYTLVSWDPRGVGISDHVVCLNDQEKGEALDAAYSLDPEGLAARTASFTHWAQACAEHTGPLLEYVDSQSTARDLDMLRAALGEQKLNYLGVSYGTQLGSIYAGLFPHHTGRLVLDGAVDSTLTVDEWIERQAVIYEAGLRDYIEACLGREECPFQGSTADGLQQVAQLFDTTFTTPLPTDNPTRPLTDTMAFTAITQVVLHQDSWPDLSAALNDAISRQDGSALLHLADDSSGRETDGSFSSNYLDASRAIICLDDRQNSDPQFMADQAKRLHDAAPTLAKYYSYAGLDCAHWPYPEAPKEFDIHAEGAAPIMVIGTTGDPTTTYAEAQQLSQTLESAFLVTWEGTGHTAYARSNDCIRDAVDDYLMDGIIPQPGLVC